MRLWIDDLSLRASIAILLLVFTAAMFSMAELAE
jgi:hypothetical protein